MVYTRMEYLCGTCHQTFFDERSAIACEHDHIVREASAEFRRALQKIMKEPPHDH